MSAQILLSAPAKLTNLKNADADKGYATGGANSKNTCYGRTAKFRREWEDIPRLATLRLV